MFFMFLSSVLLLIDCMRFPILPNQREKRYSRLVDALETVALDLKPNIVSIVFETQPI